MCIFTVEIGVHGSATVCCTQYKIMIIIDLIKTLYNDDKYVN